MASKVEAVVFDYGNVLSLPQPYPVVEQMAGVCGVTPQTFEKHYWDFRLAYDRGDIDGKSYWNEVIRQCECSLTDEQILHLIDVDNRSWSEPNEDMVKMANDLRPRGFKTAILSNMPPDFRTWLDVGVRWLPTFDHHTYSCELGVVKPDVGIYEHCVQGLALEPAQCLFIDDREVNIEAAHKLGMQAILFTNTETVLAQVEQALG